MYPQLNFPLTDLTLKEQRVWDILRKKYVKLTPEEWVRQHMIHFLINDKGYSKNLMQSEHTVNYNQQKKRCDILVFNNRLEPMIIVECKAPNIKITEDTFYQIAKYYSTLKAPLLILSNGIQHVHALISKEVGSIKYLEKLPHKKELESLTHDL